METITIFNSKIIAVEGKDEINFFRALLKNLDITDIQLIDFEGKTNFSAQIQAVTNISGFNKVSIFTLIRDADNLDPKSAFDSILSALKAANLPTPEKINTFTSTNPKIGVFIMPGNYEKGMLEDLCLKSIKDYPINKCINSFIKCSKENIENVSKSKIMCYLATKNPLVNNLGLGALKGHWNFESNVFDDIKNFLLKMK